MLYLFDANVMIDAWWQRRPFNPTDPYWVWLIHQGNNGQIKIPQEIYDEIKPREKDPFYTWITDTGTKNALILKEAVNGIFLNHVLENGYSLTNPSDTDMENITNDGFLIAYALNNPARTIVTNEVSNTNATGVNSKIPDVCNTLGIAWMNDSTALHQLGFTIP